MVRGDPQSDGRVVGTTNYRSSVPHCVGPRTRLRTALVIIITPSFSSACCATELRRDVETATIGAAYRHRALSAVDRQVRNLSRTAWQRQQPASRDATSASAVSRAPCARRTTVMPMVARAKLPSFSRFGHALARAFLLVSTASPRTSRRETGPPATSSLKTPTTSRPVYQASVSRLVRPSTVIGPSLHW